MRRCRALLLAALLVPRAALAHDDPAKALMVLDHLIKASPHDVTLLVQRAEKLRRRGNFFGALDDLVRADGMEPGRLDVLLERALLSLDSGDEQGALLRFTELLDRGPPVRVALTSRANLLAARGEHRLAREDAAAALLLGFDPDMALLRGRLDELLGDLSAACAGYEEAARELAGAHLVRVAWAKAESARGAHERALAIIADGMAFGDTKAEWLLIRADVHARAGRPRDAERDRRDALRETEQSLRERPTDLRKLTLARVLVASGRARDARRVLGELLTTSPGLLDAVKLRDQLDAEAGR